MNERDELCINRVKEEINFIRNSLKNIEKDIFLTDEILQHAILMSFIIIGENVNHLSEKFIKIHLQIQIEWQQIIAVRNIAAPLMGIGN